MVMMMVWWWWYCEDNYGDDVDSDHDDDVEEDHNDEADGEDALKVNACFIYDVTVTTDDFKFVITSQSEATSETKLRELETFCFVRFNDKFRHRERMRVTIRGKKKKKLNENACFKV